MESFFNRTIFKIILTRKEVVPVHVYPQRYCVPTVLLQRKAIDI